MRKALLNKKAYCRPRISLLFEPYPPISQLVLLLCVDVTMFLQEVRERETILLQRPGSLPCVKHVDDVQTKISHQPADVHVRAM